MSILTSIGEVVYEWSLADDRMRWSRNALEVLGVPSYDAIASGQKFETLLAAGNPTTLRDTIMNATGADTGDGVPYHIEYAMAPGGPDGGGNMWLEDTGRWYAGENGRPNRASGALRVISARHDDEQRQAYLSRFDPLTGQMNRGRLAEVLEETLVHSRRARTSSAFLVIGLDNLAAINDAYGFDIADQIIAKVSGRIKSRLRGGDALGRFSGNKFGVVLMNCGQDDIETAAGRFLAAVADEVISTEHGSVAATVTIGGVRLPGNVKSAQEAMAFAQEALDAAKAIGRGSFVCYEPSRLRAERRKNNLDAASQIVEAVNGNRLRIAYQPIIRADGASVAFHECLMRVEQEDGTIVPASVLVPIAEKLGLVRLIDHRMLKLVLDELVAHPDARLSVNVSPQTAAKSDWLDTLSAGLRGLPDAVAGRLVVEITETAAIDNPENLKKFVSRIRGLGAKVAIDDFGVGATSFRTLRDLDLDIVKIDGSFVEKLAVEKDNRAIVRALVDLANAFEIETVAEWVSDTESTDVLRDMGVDYLQGNHIAGAGLRRPIDLDGPRLSRIVPAA